MDQEITILFQKYQAGTLTQEEIKQMKKIIAGTDKSELDEQVQRLWEHYSPENKRNIRAFNEISGNLEKMFYPEKQNNTVFYLQKVAAVLLPVLFITTAYFFIKLKSYENAVNQEYTTVISSKGERATVSLPDGSKVYLNAQSSLSYPVSFAINNRTVKLMGEAYFEIVYDKNNPFTVHTSDANIRVLGTTFNLYAYPDKPLLETTLINGKVEVDFPGQGYKVMLNPGQKVCYNSSNKEINVIDTDFWLETAWRRGDLIFRSAHLRDILKQLESFYGVQIKTEGPISDELFTGSYHEENINNIFVNLQKHYTFSYKKQGNEITLKFY